MPGFLTAAELRTHPEYEHVVWDLKPTKAGRLDCGVGRDGPYKIAYELHGWGPRNILFIMGLGGLRSAWQRQCKDFGHTRGDQYSVLVLDNIGIGESDKPLRRYSTSNMAKDVLELLDHVGWTEKRSVHVVGVSMGGMISQELGLLIPERMASLSLMSTAAYVMNTVGFFENLRNRINMFIPKDIDQQLAQARGLIYTQDFLNAPDDLECVVEPFPTGGDRFGAAELKKRSTPNWFTRTGFMSQAIACGWHHKSAEQLRELAEKVGRERIAVIHGTEDKMLTLPHGEVLIEQLSQGAGADKGIRVEIFKGQGHTIPIEKRKEFDDILQDIIEKAEKLR